MKNCIILTCDEKFILPAQFICSQLKKATPLNFDIIIASGDNILESISSDYIFLYLDMLSFTNQLPESKRLRHFTYWRIPVIENLSKKYDRILYLDTDIFINDITQINNLFEINMFDQAIAAVRDVHQFTRPNRISNEHLSLGLPLTPYFNAGVLLIQSSCWRKLGLFEKIKELTITHRNHLFCHDQSLLNLASQGKWLELSPIWNWQYSKKNNFLTEMVSPKFIHFAGSTKLWSTPNGETPHRYWQAYQAFLRAKGFDQPKHTYPTVSRQIFKIWSLSLVKNIWYFGRYKRYFSRFETPFSVVAHSKRFEI